MIPCAMGSIPITHPKCLCGEIGKHNGFKLRTLRVRLPPEIPKCLGDGIGIHTGLRNRVLRVRVPPEVQRCSVSSMDRTLDYESRDRRSSRLRSTIAPFV